MTLEELAARFVDLFNKAGLDGIADEMTRFELDLANEFYGTFAACEEIMSAQRKGQLK